MKMKKKYLIKVDKKMEEGDFFVRKFDNDKIVIIKLHDKFKIFSLTCPHMGGNIIVKNNIDEKNHKKFPTFQCAWHGYIYDKNGVFIDNPNIKNTMNIRIKSKFFDPKNCVKNLEKNLALRSIEYKVKEKILIEIEI